MLGMDRYRGSTIIDGDPSNRVLIIMISTWRRMAESNLSKLDCGFTDNLLHLV